jgi:hypothetical protein
VYTLTGVALFRFLIIVRHQKNFLMHVTTVTFSSAVVPLLIIWILALAIAVPPLFHWGNYIPEVSGIRYVALKKIIFLNNYYYQLKNLLT